MTRRPRLPAAGLVFALVVAAGVTVGPRPAAANVSIRVHQVNICGQRCYGSSSFPTSEVLERVGASGTKPYFVTLQEVCLSNNQLDTFRTRMQQRG